MNVHEVLAPRPGPVPPAWRTVAQVAAGIVFLSVATTPWAGLLARFDVGVGLLLGAFTPLVALVVQVAGGLVAAALVLLCVRRPGLLVGLSLALVVPVVLLATTVPFAALAVVSGGAVAVAWRSAVAAVAGTVVGLATIVLGWVVQSSLGGPLGPVERLMIGGALGPGTLQCATLVTVLAAALAGRTLLARSLAGQERLDARTAEVEEQSAVTAERARLSRDLHDVVAHHVSLIAVRAETAPWTHPTLGAEARSVLAEIAGDARRALDELRSVLGILGRATAEDRLPQPTWHDVGGLVARATATGERVELVGDTGADVDPTTGYVAYRVVQEGLTNARKHAPGAPVTVRLERTSHLAVVSVVSGLPGGGPAPSAGPADPAVTAPISGLPWRDAGPDADGRAVPDTAVLGADGDPAARATGHGLAGMRERVEALGGRLVAGPQGDRFVVEATLPLGTGGGR